MTLGLSPLGESGLKFEKEKDITEREKSLPTRGEWIEM